MRVNELFPLQLLRLLGFLASRELGGGPTSRFVMTAISDDEVLGGRVLVFDNHTATVTSGDDVEQFDLRSGRWFDDRQNKWISLVESRSWIKATITQSQMGLATSANEQAKPLVNWPIAWRFDVSQDGEVIRLKSGYFDYRVNVTPG